MAEPKTKLTRRSVAAFIATLPDPETRRDCRTLVAMMKKATGAPARMWGPSIIGCGTWRMTYASGRTGDWPVAAFSPRKQSLVVYLEVGFTRHKALLKGLGPHKTGKCCLYIKRLADVDLARLDRLVRLSVAGTRRTNPAS